MRYDNKCDVFSLGMTFYTLINDDKPHPVIDGVASYLQEITVQNWLRKKPFNSWPINFDILNE